MKCEDKILFSSFLQISGISRKKEANLWASGIDTLEKLQISNKCQQSLFDETDDEISQCIHALENEDPSIFLEKLEAKDYFRIAYSFPDQVMFLDIETTGLSTRYHYVTMVGWMINGKYDYWLQGSSPEKLIHAVNSAKMLITYNGILFDCKFLDHALNTKTFSSKPNLDLMHLCRRFQLTGGQKLIEEYVGFSRPAELKTANGKEAIAQWYEFLFENDNSIDDLISYNYYDIQGMAYILDWVFFKKIYGISFPKTRGCRPYHFANLWKLDKVKFPSKKMRTEIRRYVKAEISNFEKDFLSSSNRFRIVGIDLAGKVNSRSGVCLLQKDYAETKVLHENEDIIKLVHFFKPDLISIDAPLSLPKGRTTVYDDDPYRKEGGILRYCERMLKKRNVNCYPALIRSMQELTKRGIELAAYFRSQGYPVIECFPGAAQDIIQLPRKRTDETLLKKGLLRFGIHGPFENTEVCHDELDAITASLVGQFFISGYYEALGIPEENDMIIPQKTYREWPYEVVIGVCGPILAGKTEVAEYIRQKGFSYIRYSKVRLLDVSERTADFNLAALQQKGWSVYDVAKQYALNKRLEDQIQGASHIVVDGVSHLEDFTYWKERCFSRFYLIYIEADFSVREFRYAKKMDYPVEYYDALTHPIEPHILSLLGKADFMVDNNGSIKDLYQKIDGILEKIL